jgi:hypothetical protein
MSDKPKLDPPWEVRESFYTGVGQTISFWANMETIIIEIAAIALGTTEQKTGLVFYSIQNFHSWLNILDDLFNSDDGLKDRRSEWTDISSDLRAMNETRVRLAHHTVWGKSEKGDEFGLKPGQYDTRTKSKRHAPLTANEIRAFSESIDVIEEKLNKLRDSLKPPSGLVAAFAGISSPLTGGLLGLGALLHPNPTKPEDPPQSSGE